MSKLEEAIRELGCKSWHGANVVGGDTDFYPVGQRDFEEHKDKCAIWQLYKELVAAATNVKAAWYKTSKSAKEMLFDAAMIADSKDKKSIQEFTI